MDSLAKEPHLTALSALLAAAPSMTTAEATAWQTVARSLMPVIHTLDLPPVQMPDMPAPQVMAWHAVLDLDEHLDTPWVLVGGQMVALWCAQAEVNVFRPTEDADVVLDVWVQRSALTKASRLLNERGFSEAKTEDGYGYRYQCDDATVDLMIPDHMERQAEQPATTTGRLGVPAAGGNQALIRAERIPVHVGGKESYVRRPNLLGALVAKAAAAVADTRERDRHRDDIAVLAQIALDRSAHRTMRASCNPKDRRRLRLALEEMPPTHRAWQRITEAELARRALHRLAHDGGS